MAVKPIPDGYHSITPYLSIKGAAEAIEFYLRAFGATESFRLVAPNGNIGHAEIRIGGSVIMLADSCEGGPFRNPQSLGGSSVGLHAYVEDVDALFAQAVAAGAKVVRPVQDQFYGDRTGTLEDPFGHVWFLATRKEDLTWGKSASVRRHYSSKARPDIATPAALRIEYRLCTCAESL